MNARFLATLRSRPVALLLGLWLPLLVQQLHYRLSSFAHLLAFDTQITYLPLARRVLEDASGLFADPAHLAVAPGSYLYLALFGADNALAVQGNLVLSGLLLLLAFDTLRRVAGFAAGAAVAWLLALGPLLPEVLVPALSEPLQLFCIGVWLWCSALLFERPRRRWPVLLGGLALLLSILTRATYVYWIVAALGACLLLAWRGTPPLRQVATRWLVLHLIAGTGTLAYIGYNKVTFDLPMVATGSGAALYFGSNPAVAGYEPPYYNLLHDHFLILDKTYHLSLEGDRRLNRAAKAALADLPAPVLADLLLQKAGATLFFSQATLSRKPFNARTWHVLLLTLAAVGLWRYRREPVLWLLGCVAAYQLAIMSLVMHSARYAVGALELPLTLLAGFGIAGLWQVRRQWRVPAGVAGVLLLGAVAGALHQRYSRPLMPDLSHVPHQRVAVANPGQLRLEGLDGNPFLGDGARTLAQDASIRWNTLDFPLLGGLPVVRVEAKDFDPDCDYIQFDYLRPDGQVRGSRLRLNHMAPPQLISTGTLQLDALIPQGGDLRLRFRCPVGTRLKLDNLEIHYITRSQRYRQQIDGQP